METANGRVEFLKGFFFLPKFHYHDERYRVLLKSPDLLKLDENFGFRNVCFSIFLPTSKIPENIKVKRNQHSEIRLPTPLRKKSE